VYQDATYDESDEIRSMLPAVAEWHVVAVDDPDVEGLVRRMVAVHDEPVATATWLSHWVLSGAVADAGFDTLFGGLGGDELNAGEYEYFAFHFADLRAQGREAELSHEVELWAEHHDHPIWRKGRSVMEADLARRTDPRQAGRNLADLERIRRYAGAIRSEWYDLRSYVPVMDHPFTSHLKNRAYQDLFRETTPCCLRAEDRHAAAHGMEHADPFLDHRLIELLFRVPGDRKIRDGVTKRLLREAMREVLPEETRARVKKTGWNAPAHVWFAGESADRLRALIGSPRFADRGIYDVAEVQRLLDDHQTIVASGAQQENHMMFFWQLLNLECWLEWLEDTRW
jgi:asparagine synthase (glutamine-hydrolysing)